VKPEDIDMVMCTHLHVDHVGWNTRLDNGRWVPTFPNARYVFSKIDFDHFSAIDRDPKEGPAIGGALRDSVIRSSRRDSPRWSTALRRSRNICRSRRRRVTPGHVRSTSPRRVPRRFFSGDIIHHVIQLYHPTWNSFACADQDTARKSRRMTLEKCAGSGALLLPQHFGAPHICHVDRKAMPSGRGLCDSAHSRESGNQGQGLVPLPRDERIE